MNTSEFIDKANLVHNKKYTYLYTSYINSRTKIIITCPTHGNFEQGAREHLRGQGCIKCSRQYRETNFNLFVDKANKIHNNKYNYNQVLYVNKRTKISIICPIHGEFTQTPDIHLDNHGCPKCKSSKGEITIRKYLEDKNIVFIPQKTFSDCKYKNKLSFDFYLPSYNLCIEYQGKQHYEPIKAWGGKDTLKLTQLRDAIKKKYCDNNGINYLDIPYYKDILNILENTLSHRKVA
jgi:hypothetical protein